MSDLNLKVSLEEANTILTALGERPFREVFGLVNKIQQQAGEQLASQKKNPEEGKALAAVTDEKLAEAM